MTKKKSALVYSDGEMKEYIANKPGDVVEVKG
jgi:hypothetical protein